MSLVEDYNRKKADRPPGPPIKKPVPLSFTDNTLPPPEEMPKRPHHPTVLDGVKA